MTVEGDEVLYVSIHAPLQQRGEHWKLEEIETAQLFQSTPRFSSEANVFSKVAK